jgi:hypothetical protein
LSDRHYYAGSGSVSRAGAGLGFVSISTKRKINNTFLIIKLQYSAQNTEKYYTYETDEKD